MLGSASTERSESGARKTSCEPPLFFSSLAVVIPDPDDPLTCLSSVSPQLRRSLCSLRQRQSAPLLPGVYRRRWTSGRRSGPVSPCCSSFLPAPFLSNLTPVLFAPIFSLRTFVNKINRTEHLLPRNPSNVRTSNGSRAHTLWTNTAPDHMCGLTSHPECTSA